MEKRLMVHIGGRVARSQVPVLLSALRAARPNFLKGWDEERAVRYLERQPGGDPWGRLEVEVEDIEPVRETCQDFGLGFNVRLDDWTVLEGRDGYEREVRVSTQGDLVVEREWFEGILKTLQAGKEDEFDGARQDLVCILYGGTLARLEPFTIGGSAVYRCSCCKDHVYEGALVKREGGWCCELCLPENDPDRVLLRQRWEEQQEREARECREREEASEALRARGACTECGVSLSPKVCQSAAGYYVGRWCGCGPYSRESDYYATRGAAEAALGPGAPVEGGEGERCAR